MPFDSPHMISYLSSIVIMSLSCIIFDLTTICLHVNYKAHMACDLSVIVKNERVLEVTGSHVYFKSGSI